MYEDDTIGEDEDFGPTGTDDDSTDDLTEDKGLPKENEGDGERDETEEESFGGDEQ